ncbi:MAG: VOC family protein [Hyphomicrobiaceae bacterium]|nr:VOC family protein [Hyphomicrobiaceae bacterium]
MTNFKNPTPILRMFDEDKAREFYVDFLSFSINWEHRFEENFPLYMEVARDGCVLHLSEHHGDSCPGGTVRIEVSGIEDLQRDLAASGYKFAKPALSETPWDTREMQITDPFGNRLVFFEPLET